MPHSWFMQMPSMTICWQRRNTKHTPPGTSAPDLKAQDDGYPRPLELMFPLLNGTEYLLALRARLLLHPLEEQLALQPSLPPSHCRCARITPLTEEVPHAHQDSLDEPFHENFKLKTQTEPRIPLKVLPSPPPQPPAPEDPAPTTTTGDPQQQRPDSAGGHVRADLRINIPSKARTFVLDVVVADPAAPTHRRQNNSHKEADGASKASHEHKLLDYCGHTDILQAPATMNFEFGFIKFAELPDEYRLKVSETEDKKSESEDKNPGSEDKKPGSEDKIVSIWMENKKSKSQWAMELTEDVSKHGPPGIPLPALVYYLQEAFSSLDKSSTKSTTASSASASTSTSTSSVAENPITLSAAIGDCPKALTLTLIVLS
eukprot:gene616-668_t